MNIYIALNAGSLCIYFTEKYYNPIYNPSYLSALNSYPYRFVGSFPMFTSVVVLYLAHFDHPISLVLHLCMGPWSQNLYESMSMCRKEKLKKNAM